MKKRKEKEDKIKESRNDVRSATEGDSDIAEIFRILFRLWKWLYCL